MCGTTFALEYPNDAYCLLLLLDTKYQPTQARTCSHVSNHGIYLYCMYLVPPTIVHRVYLLYFNTLDTAVNTPLRNMKQENRDEYMKLHQTTPSEQNNIISLPLHISACLWSLVPCHFSLKQIIIALPENVHLPQAHSRNTARSSLSAERITNDTLQSRPRSQLAAIVPTSHNWGP